MKVSLPPEMQTLLLEVAKKYSIDISDLLLGNMNWELSNIEALIDAISTEFVATGLQANSEPNERGLRLEDLLDRLNKFN